MSNQLKLVAIFYQLILVRLCFNFLLFARWFSSLGSRKLPFSVCLSLEIYIPVNDSEPSVVVIIEVYIYCRFYFLKFCDGISYANLRFVEEVRFYPIQLNRKIQLHVNFVKKYFLKNALNSYMFTWKNNLITLNSKVTDLYTFFYKVFFP